MKGLIFLFMLLVSLFNLPVDAIAASEKQIATISPTISDVVHFKKFESATIHLMVWDYHQKTTDFCQTKCPF